MRPVFRLSGDGTGRYILLCSVLAGTLLAIAVVVALFDWNWLRPSIERYLAGTSGREVRADDLHIAFGAGFEPTVRLRGVYIENTPWAAKQPMAVAGEAAFTFSLRSVWEGRPVISRLVLIDADVDMERQPDGLRNWRLVSPEYRGPGRVKVLTLEAHRTRIRFVNRTSDLDITAESSPVQAEAAGARARQPLASRIEFKGTYQGAAFSGMAATSTLISLRESGKSFPLRGYFIASKTRVEVDGVVADILDLSAADAKVRLAGPTLSALHPFTRFRPAVSRPYQFRAQLSYGGDEYAASRLRGRIGDTDLAGEGSYNPHPERPFLRAALRSHSATLEDLGTLVGISLRADPGASAQAERLFSSRELNAGRLGIDALVTLEAKKLRSDDIPALDSLRVAAELTDRVLQLKPLDLGVAGGHVVTTLTFDGRDKTPSARATLDARNLRLERLFPSLPASARGIGALSAHASLSGRGTSVAALIGSASGSVSAVAGEGRISNLLDAKLGMNTVKIVGLLMRGDREIALHCGALAVDFRNGSGTSRSIVLDTEQTRIEGVGNVDLREEQFDLLLTPQLKHKAVLALNSSIRVHGSFRQPALAIVPRNGAVVPASLPAQGPRCNNQP